MDQKIVRSKTFSGTYASRLDEGDSFIFRRLPLLEQRKLWPVILRERWQAGRSRAVAKRSLTICNRDGPHSVQPSQDKVDYDCVLSVKGVPKTRLHNVIVSKDNKLESLVSCSGKLPTVYPNTEAVQFGCETKKESSRIRAARVELELAIKKDDIAKLLLAIRCKTVNLNEADRRGKTLLHSACSVGNYRCAQILIDAGARVDVKDQAGFTALHCAVVSNHVPCAAVLISSGADVMASTNTMHTVLTLAHEEEMILLIGRTLLLRDTLMTSVGENRKEFQLRSLKETNL